MNISILTVFSELYEPFLRTSLIHKAQQKGLIHIDVTTFFSFVQPKERIDAPTCGPGAGMLIRPDVVDKALRAQEQKHGPAYKIFFSPQGEKLNQHLLKKITKGAQSRGHVMLIPARYEGMDARVEEQYADVVVSVGDFVLMGGDLPAMMLLEGMLRLVPGVVGKEESVRDESFSGPFLDYPEYTTPIDWHGKLVPEIVRSGNHAAIEKWRIEQAARKTVIYHFAWLRSQFVTKEQRDVAASYVPHHYVALLHSDVLIGEDRTPGVTSVTSLDIHDIARSSCAYGIKNFFVVTPLHDQQKIVQTFLDFWQTGYGIEYNRNRHEAVKTVQIADSLNKVVLDIEKKEGKKPLIIATSARAHGHSKGLSYWDQAIIWSQDRPVLLIFGTGKGLTEEVIAHCDYLLYPVHGFTDFNHLSVRSAVAIVLDRWLGIIEKRDN